MAETIRSLSAADVLRAWEVGQPQHPVDRALTLLSLGTGAPRSRLASLPVGQRDALLLALREITLGPRLVSSARCPECTQQLEMSFSAGDIRISDLPDTLVLADEVKQAEVPIEHSQMSGEFGSYHLTYRLPNSEDLAAILNARDVEDAQKTLLRRCVLEARQQGALLDPGDLPGDVLLWLGERISQADPHGDILLDLSCPNCSHQWQAIFDIGTFFWREVDAISKRLLQDVHTLASTYGWGETDILNMSAVRRQAYLDKVIG